MQINDMVREAKDAITVRRVFTEPYEVGGVTVIAAAKVGGGGGGVALVWLLTRARITRARLKAGRT